MNVSAHGFYLQRSPTASCPVRLLVDMRMIARMLDA